MYHAADWSPNTYALLLSCMILGVLAVFATFVIVLVRAANAEDPPRRAASVEPTEEPAGEHDPGDVAHLHAA